MSTSSPSDLSPKSTTSNDFPLQTMAPTSPENPVAGPSTTPNVTEEGPPINKKEDGTCMAFKGKTLDESRREFMEECAKIEEEHPEIAYKDGWSELHETLKTRDEKDIKKHSENIDTLLVFAGLYSAILTAFLVEAYKLLQRDSSDAGLQVLLEISHQLGSFTVTSGFANATYIPSSLPTGLFVPERSSVWLNSLWFVSLILSLMTASLGLLVKQWLREYADNPGATPEEQRRIRLFRVRGLRKYKVSEIATFLPLLLQISLILFFSGLVLFTRGVHATIGRVILVFVAAWGTFLVITTILPWFSASCPYKTPFLKPITLQFKQLLDPLNSWLKDSAKDRFQWIYDRLPETLLGHDAETKASKELSYDVEVLVDAYETSENANVWETIMHCIDLQRPSTSIAHLRTVIIRRYSLNSAWGLAFQAWVHLPPENYRLFVSSLSTCIQSRLIQAFERKENSKLDDASVDLLLQLDRWNSLLGSSSRVDRALAQMSSALLRASFSAPFTRESLVKYASGLLESGIDTLRKWEYFDKSTMSAFIQASNQVFETSGTLGDEDEFLNQSHRILLCAGRSTEECWPVLKNEFLQLSLRIASGVNSLPDLSYWQDPLIIFKCHCALDMTMRLHKRIPGIIDKTLFEALHTYSVKIFDLYVKYEEHEDKKLTKYIWGQPEGESQTFDASIEPINWDEVLDRYDEVEVRGRGEYTEYGDKWDYQRLQVDCKHRMEFILNYERGWHRVICQVVSDCKF